MYANLGYAVVATDYAGLGADSGKPVIDMESNALDVMYSVPAARAAVKEIGQKWIVVGAFQGALAAVAVAESELRDPTYLGSVLTAGLADAQPVYERFASGSASSSRMIMALAYSIKTLNPDFQLSDVLKNSALPAYHRLMCSGAEPDSSTEMLKPGWENNKFVKEFFSANTPAQRPARGPLLVISGELDQGTPAELTEKTVACMCKQRDRILFLKYPDLDASGATGTSVADQISWIKARFAGYAAPSNCR
jgi:fermentation-respiration switch protein FrsA (DUF1100 family)